MNWDTILEIALCIECIRHIMYAWILFNVFQWSYLWYLVVWINMRCIWYVNIVGFKVKSYVKVNLSLFDWTCYKVHIIGGLSILNGLSSWHATWWFVEWVTWWFKLCVKVVRTGAFTLIVLHSITQFWLGLWSFFFVEIDEEESSSSGYHFYKTLTSGSFGNCFIFHHRYKSIVRKGTSS